MRGLLDVIGMLGILYGIPATLAGVALLLDGEPWLFMVGAATLLVSFITCASRRDQ